MKKQSIALCMAALLIGCMGGGYDEVDYEMPFQAIESPRQFTGTGPDFEPAFPPVQPPFRTPEENHPVDQIENDGGNPQPSPPPGGGNNGGGGSSNCNSACAGDQDCIDICEEICSATDACSVCICNNLSNPYVCEQACSG